MGTQDSSEQGSNYSLGTRELNERIENAIDNKSEKTPLDELDVEIAGLKDYLLENNFTETHYGNALKLFRDTKIALLTDPLAYDKATDKEIGFFKSVADSMSDTMLGEKALDRSNTLKVKRERELEESSSKGFLKMLELFDSADYKQITPEMLNSAKKHIQRTWLEPISNCAPSQEFSSKKLGTQAYENFVYMQAKLAREGVLEVQDFIEDVEYLLQMKQDYNAPLSELEKELSKEFYEDIMKLKESGVVDNDALQSFVERLQIGALHFLEGKSDKRFEVRDTYSNWRIPIRMFIQEILGRDAYDGKPLENRDIENSIARQIALGNNETVLSALQAYSNLTNPNYNPRSN